MALHKVKSTNDTEVYLANFEEITRKVPVIRFNKEIIVIPDICAITPEGKDTFIKRLLNSSEDFVSVSKESFEDMLRILELIKTENHILVKESRVKPKHTILVNLEVLKNNAVFVKSSGNVLEVNGIIFTDSELEFQGFGLFTTKEPIFISYEEMAHIKEILTLLSED